MALAAGGMILAECTGRGEKHIEVPQEREAPALFGTASVSIISTINATSVMVTSNYANRILG